MIMRLNDDEEEAFDATTFATARHTTLATPLTLTLTQSVCETALNPIKVNNLDQASLNIFERTLNP